jgi:hypothetical protein
MWMGPALVIAALVALPARAADSPEHNQNFSWIDKNGERHYGDSVPPEYAQSERRVLNNQGVEVQHIGAEKNAQQLAEERQREQEAERRAQHDNFLLTTYTSTKDIERLRDERVDQLNGQITAANAYIESLETRLQSLQQRAMHFKPYNTKPDARRMPDDLAEQLVRTANEVRAQRKSLERRAAEITTVHSQFDADIARYHELTSGPAAH